MRPIDGACVESANSSTNEANQRSVVGGGGGGDEDEPAAANRPGNVGPQTDQGGATPNPPRRPPQRGARNQPNVVLGDGGFRAPS